MSRGWGLGASCRAEGYGTSASPQPPAPTRFLRARRSLRRRLCRSLRRALRLLGDRREGRGAADGEFGKALSIERHAGVLQSVDQLSVGEPVLARGRIDPDDPQPTEIALLAAAADERVFERRVDRLFRGAIQLALVGVIALRQAKQLLALGAPDRSSFYPRHLFAPSQRQLKILELRIKNSRPSRGVRILNF